MSGCVWQTNPPTSAPTAPSFRSFYRSLGWTQTLSVAYAPFSLSNSDASLPAIAQVRVPRGEADWLAIRRMHERSPLPWMDVRSPERWRQLREGRDPLAGPWVVEGGDGAISAYACVLHKNGVWVVGEFGLAGEVSDPSEAEATLRALFAHIVAAKTANMDETARSASRSGWVALPLSPCRAWGVLGSFEEDESLRDGGWLVMRLGAEELGTAHATRWLTDNF